MATTTATPLELPPRQPGRGMAVARALALAAAGGKVWITAPAGNWNLVSMGVITVFATVSDLTAVESGHSRLKVSGTALGLMLAVILLGAAPAAVIGVVTLLVGWICRPNRSRVHLIGADLVIYAWLLLIIGLFFHGATGLLHVGPQAAYYYLLAFVTFVLSLALNF